MIFSYNWLQDYLKGSLPEPKKFAKLFMAKSFEVEGIEKVGEDFALDIDIKPNRAPDCLSHFGVSRECAAVFGLELKELDIALREEKGVKTKDLIGVEVKSKTACPRYSVRVVDNVKVGSSPVWLKERLELCGVQPINNIVDIANFVMLETGQPLHAFDLEKIAGKELIVRFAKQGEKITTLDNQKFNLNKEMLVIADKKEPIAIAGIKGGKGPEIDKKTKTVVLESANFDRITIRKTSQALKLKTDASWRFENGIDPNLTEQAINRAASLIGELASGKVAQGLVDFYPQKPSSKTIKLDIEYIGKLLGVAIPKKQAIQYLENLGFKIAKDKGNQVLVQVPSFRMDVLMSEDLIEEIGRLYGYEKIPTIAPLARLIPPKRNLNIFWEEFSKDVLKEAGFSEVYNYSFINAKKAEIFGYKSSDLLEIENPLSENQQYLTPSLICNLLGNAKENLKYFDSFSIFELGKTFLQKRSKIEKRMLSGLIVEKNASGDSAFYLLKGVIDLLFEKLGISNVWYDSFEPTSEESRALIWHPTKCSEIKIGGKEIGFLGEVASQVLKKMKIGGRAVLFDIDFGKLQELSSEEHQYQVISPYPSAIRDLAVLVPQQVLVEQVLSEINRAGGILVRNVDLFDIYQGEEIAEGKKNLAFHIVYQAEDRTLNFEEIESLHKKIVQCLEKNLEWEVRK